MLHTSTPTSRLYQGTVGTLKAIEINFNTIGAAAGLKLFSIRASVNNPVLVKFMTEVVTGFNALTTNVLTFGTNATATQIYGAADITEGTVGFGVPKYVRYTANTDIFAKYTQSGTAATAGRAIIYFEFWELTSRSINA